jgi:hypothetical protein
MWYEQLQDGVEDEAKERTDFKIMLPAVGITD